LIAVAVNVLGDPVVPCPEIGERKPLVVLTEIVPVPLAEISAGG
jgi:hypothetical protein